MVYRSEQAAVWTARVDLFFLGQVNVRLTGVGPGIGNFSPSFQALQRKDRHLAYGREPCRLDVCDLIDLDGLNRHGRQSHPTLFARISLILDALTQWTDHRA
jgi:hypothetical protein